MPSLKPDGASHLQKTLDAFAKEIPGCFLTVATTDSILFDGCSGHFDMLEKGEDYRRVTKDDVMWFASTTKLLTAVCYLQLVDRGILSLDTVLGDKFPPLAKASEQVLQSIDADGKPVFVPAERPITLRMMLNQTSGFGMEFGKKIPEWKKIATKGKGFVNSCKVENLIYTPICNQPGTTYEYGNSAEWLALMLPTILGGQSTEDYLQENVLRPLGMSSTTYYPFGPEFDDRLLPVRYAQSTQVDSTGREEMLAPGEDFNWEVLNGQLDLLTLPRRREEIEYPAGGGGIYSKTSDYVLLLQYLLRHKQSLVDPSAFPPPTTKILSDEAVQSIFTGTLPPSALPGMVEMYNPYLALSEETGGLLQAGEVDWTTAFAIYQPKSGRRREGFGRLPGSCGWGGAAGTEYWIDREAGIAVSAESNQFLPLTGTEENNLQVTFTTQMLPGNGPVVKTAKKRIEKAVYEALGI